MAVADSVTCFDAALVELGLTDIKSKFADEGWATFNDFAFSSSDTSGKSTETFEKEVVPKLIDLDNATEKKLLARLRRLYAQSYIIMSSTMEALAKPQGVDERVHMSGPDRAMRLKALKDRLTGVKIVKQNVPSITLTDRFATILKTGSVKYISWERCTSRDAELMEEPEVRGLRLTAKGELTQDLMPDQHTDLSSELLWDYALRRRAVAGDVAGLMTFEAATL